MHDNPRGKSATYLRQGSNCILYWIYLVFFHILLQFYSKSRRYKTCSGWHQHCGSSGSLQPVRCSNI